MLSLLLMLAPFAQASLIDDGYHFSQFSANPNVADYGEWWFFDFYQNNVKGLIQYSLWDPTGATQFSFGLMYVSIQRAGTTLDVYFPIPWDYIATDSNSANLAIGPETISVNSGVYTISGDVADAQGNEVMWNLQYIQQLPSLNGIRDLPTAPGEAMNWYVQMPSAVVYGAIIVNGQTIAINGARGYHDHNWGVWKLSDTVWNWFQTSTPNMAITAYDFYAVNKGQITTQFNGQTITFQKSQYLVINYAWTTLAGLPFPQKTVVLAANSQATLLLNIQVNPLETGSVAREYPGVAWFVLDSNAIFNGLLITHHGVTAINSVGFREYAFDVPLP